MTHQATETGTDLPSETVTFEAESPPERIYLEVDTDDITGRHVAQHGEQIDDSTAIVEETHAPGVDHCEGCGDSDGWAYMIDDMYGVPVCIDCLAAYGFVPRIDTDRAAIVEGRA